MKRTIALVMVGVSLFVLSVLIVMLAVAVEFPIFQNWLLIMSVISIIGSITSFLLALRK